MTGPRDIPISYSRLRTTSILGCPSLKSMGRRWAILNQQSNYRIRSDCHLKIIFINFFVPGILSRCVFILLICYRLRKACEWKWHVAFSSILLMQGAMLHFFYLVFFSFTNFSMPRYLFNFWLLYEGWFLIHEFCFTNSNVGITLSSVENFNSISKIHNFIKQPLLSIPVKLNFEYSILDQYSFKFWSVS